jgi:hypothetical protein
VILTSIGDAQRPAQAGRRSVIVAPVALVAFPCVRRSRAETTARTAGVAPTANILGSAGAIFLGIAATMWALVACGRTGESAHPCPAVGTDCTSLGTALASAERAYADATERRDGVAMDDAAQCVQVHVDAAVDATCVERCAELCRLHPCDVLDDAGVALGPAECAGRCATLRDSGAFDNDDLDLALFKAAENPGLCSCRACTAFDDALCTRLFDCAPSTTP